MDKHQLSHDIFNVLERLRIMHDLIRDKNYEHISEEELMSDLAENLVLLEKLFKTLAQ